MRKSFFITALCALVFSIGLAGTKAANAATINVLHGTKAETLDTEKQPAGGVYLIRPEFEPDPKQIKKVKKELLFL